MKTNQHSQNKKPATILEEMGNNIRRMRILKGMTQKKFCEYALISRSTLHDIENGSSSIQVGNLLKALQTLGIESHLTRIGIHDKLWITSFSEQLIGRKRVRQ